MKSANRFRARRLVGAVIALTLVASCSDDPTIPKKQTTLSFEEDFSSDTGWTNETDGDFRMRNGVLACMANRSKVQKMYIPISPYSGNFTMEFDFKTEWGSNVWLEVGLAESLAGALNDPVNDPTGASVQFGHHGEHDAFRPYYIFPLGRYRDQTFYHGGFNPDDYATYLACYLGSWIHAKLEVVGKYWRLSLTDMNSKREVGQRTGTFPERFGQYKYVYIGNPDDEDWSEGMFYVDNLSFSSEVNWENPCPTPCSTPPADPMPSPDRLIVPWELYFDEPFTLSWDDVWTGCGGYELVFEYGAHILTFDVVSGNNAVITIPRPGCETLVDCLIKLRSYWGGTCDDRVYSEPSNELALLTIREADEPFITFTWSEEDSAVITPADTIGPIEVPGSTAVQYCWTVHVGCFKSNVVGGYRYRWDGPDWDIDWTPFVGEPTGPACMHSPAYAPGTHIFLMELIAGEKIFSYAVEFKFI